MLGMHLQPYLLSDIGKKFYSDRFIALPIKLALGASLHIGVTSAGVFGTALSVLTLGTQPSINRFALNTGNSAYLITDTIYRPLMAIINPEGKTDRHSSLGVVTKRIARPIFEAAGNCSKDKNILKKHVVSRAAYLTGAVVATVTRTVDFALGVFAALASMATLRIFTEVNTFASQHLKATAVIHDVCCGIRGFVNPTQHHLG